MINFISNLPQYLRSGGFSAMNVAAFEALASQFSVRYVGPINPPPIAWEKALSKLLRAVGLQGNFAFFSARRLKTIAQSVSEHCTAGAELDFFHGFTPWIMTRPPRPYITWSDCTFHDYIHIFHRAEQFRPSDLARIERIEAGWLANAARVIFRSRWAAGRAIARYALAPSRVDAVCSFGEIELPERDTYAGGNRFVFVSTDFEAKGGRVAISALREVRKRHPEATLTIIGDRPSNWVGEPGIELVGFLRKEIPSENAEFKRLLSAARALVHPTTSDVSPLVILEAGYFGCPSIVSRGFAIPEVVEHGTSGLLVDNPLDVGAVAAAMCRILEMGEGYVRMRGNAWSVTREQHSKKRFRELLITQVANVLSSHPPKSR